MPANNMQVLEISSSSRIMDFATPYLRHALAFVGIR
jgi:hypothetical protein